MRIKRQGLRSQYGVQLPVYSYKILYCCLGFGRGEQPVLTSPAKIVQPAARGREKKDQL